MIVQSASRASSTSVSSTRVSSAKALAGESLGRPQCPRCTRVLLVAEESRFNVDGQIDHAWSCDDCGQAFVTSIRLWRR
jgi:RNase P subunit RPR2